MARSIFRNVLIIKRAEIIKDRSVFEKIEEERLKIGATVTDLCAEAGMSRQNYYRWRKGTGGIMEETRTALIAALKRLSRDAKESERSKETGERSPLLRDDAT
jgi:transcriptional regulator with XRE-family HTH domain